ncbi:leucine-rich repeat domain-containing protein [Marinicella meishanensis]|uniref:leucine-rich repeat domain-containing protein n=1 Tax=Marinicella meishanensis TaxID=2873263 RepID=UPI001CC15157|nr:leucine-rich repeat domain-containing protein [Marinicella sp. NBU2979]
MNTTHQLLRWTAIGCLMAALLACQSETTSANNKPVVNLAPDQTQALQQWMQVNGWSEDEFQFGTDHHQGAYSVLTEHQQVVAIKAKGVTATAGLDALTSLRSLELSLQAQTQLSTCPEQLQHLRINGQPAAPLALGFLTTCPQLTELALYYAPIKDWQGLAGLSNLQSLTLRHTDLTAIDFGHSWPQLSRLDIRDNQLQTVSFAVPLTQLKELFLSHNQLRVLPDLSALTALTTLSVDDNPLMTMAADHLPPQLKTLDLRNTTIIDLAPLVGLPDLHRVQFQRRPKILPTALDDKVFAAIDEDSQLAIAEGLMAQYMAGVQFTEQLPKLVNGKALGLHKQSSQHFSLSGTSDLSGHIRIDEIQGLMRIPLAQTDDLLYQQRQVTITGQAQVNDGTFMVYSPVKLDFWQMAAIFVDHPQPEPPTQADLQRHGYLVYQALPGQPVTFTANLIPMADRYLLLVGSDVATGVSITYD